MSDYRWVGKKMSTILFNGSGEMSNMLFWLEMKIKS